MSRQLLMAFVGGLAGGMGWGLLLAAAGYVETRCRRAQQEQDAREAWQKLGELDKCYRVDGGPRTVNVN